MHTRLSNGTMACVVVGAVGGAIAARLTGTNIFGLIALGALYGLIFALAGAVRATSPGAGLLWGLGYALSLWLIGPAGLFPFVGFGGPAMPAMGMLDAAR
ncbi:MAG TPA: hypothetical protein VGJ87_12385, partial [Roseiflexaceae bacterium]